MEKWNRLKEFLINGLVSAEAGELHEHEKHFRIVLEKMVEIEKEFDKQG